MSSINTLNILNKNSEALAKSLDKVSSGMKINSAADGPGYAGPIQSAEQQRLVPAAMRRQQKSARRALFAWGRAYMASMSDM